MVAFDVQTADGRALRVVGRKTPEGGIVKTIWDLTDDHKQARGAGRSAHRRRNRRAPRRADFLSSMRPRAARAAQRHPGLPGAAASQRDKREPLSERQRDRVAQILAGGEHLLRLIDDILDLSRIEAGGVSMSVEPVNVADVLAEVVKNLGPMTARQGLDLTVTSPPPDVPMVSADRTRFAQILMNFGSNAIKYNRPSGKVWFEVSLPSAIRVRVSVHDTEHRHSHRQAGQALSAVPEGGPRDGADRGHGHRLSSSPGASRASWAATSAFTACPGQGSTFWVDLAVREKQESSAAAQRAADETGPTLSASTRRRILYVEDNPANLAFMRDLVSTVRQRRHHDGTDGRDGPRAVPASERRTWSLMDINLPGMNGFEAHAPRASSERGHPEDHRSSPPHGGGVPTGTSSGASSSASSAT